MTDGYYELSRPTAWPKDGAAVGGHRGLGEAGSEREEGSLGTSKGVRLVSHQYTARTEDELDSVNPSPPHVLGPVSALQISGSQLTRRHVQACNDGLVLRR